MGTLLTLWDTYILEESPLLHLFVCLAWVNHFRQQLLSTESSSIHSVVVRSQREGACTNAQRARVVPCGVLVRYACAAVGSDGGR
jgi:hypothetical protein